MVKSKSLERIEIMRKGKKIKCTRCEVGYISAIGEPETTSLFRCDGCGTSMVLTKAIKKEFL